MVFDMADIIDMVRLARAVTEYVSLNVVPFLENQLTSTSCLSTVGRVDAIWDTYHEKNSNH